MVSILRLAYGFVSLGAPLGLILAVILTVGLIPALVLALAVWLLLVIMIVLLAFRIRAKLEVGRNQVYWPALGLGGGVAVGFVLFSGFLYAFQWLVLAVIVTGTVSLMRSFLEMRRDWPRVSLPTRRFLRNLLTVNIPTSAFLISYLFIVFPRSNSLLALALVYAVYIIPNGAVFAKRFKELLSSRPASNEKHENRKI